MATVAGKPTERPAARTNAIKQAMVNVRRRRTYLIAPEIQFSITRQFLVVLVAASALGIGNYHVAGIMLEAARGDGFGLMVSLVYCGVMFAISASLLFLLCVFFSHRIAGPARKVSEVLDGMAHGDLAVKVTLRDNDLLTELAQAVNETNRSLRGSLSELEREIRRARSLADGNPELAGCLARAEAQLGGFRLSTSTPVDPRAAISLPRSG